MDKQKVFNKVYRHLLRQGVKSITKDKDPAVCQYRQGKLKCAIGALIPDGIYDPKMEGSGIAALFYSFPILVKALGVDDRSSDRAFLMFLQDVHDDLDPRDWPEALKRFAERFGLEVPAVKVAGKAKKARGRKKS